MFLKRSHLTLAFTLTLSLLTGNGCDGQEFSFEGQSPLKTSQNKSLRKKSENRFHEIFELYKERVVFISTEKKVTTRPIFPFLAPFLGDEPRTRKETGLGSGFFLSKDGYICTNHHVVAEMDRVKVRIEKRTYEAEVIGSDELLDIALLKIEPREGEEFKPVYLGDSEKIRVGDWSIAIGNPFGLERTFTVGVISAAVREAIDLPGNAHIQTDASINPGNSGGPLINLDGEVIGVNRMIYSQSGGDVGIGFAIPINYARKALDDLKKHRKVIRGYIGVQIADLTEEIAERLGLKIKEGALITETIPGGPAQKAGLQRGDVVVKINSVEIKKFSDLLQETARSPIGSTIRVEYIRNNRRQSVRVKVAERP